MKNGEGPFGFEKLFWFQCFVSSAQIKTKIKNHWPLFSKTMLFDWLRAQVTCLWQLKQTKSEIPGGPLSIFHALFGRSTALFSHFLIDVLTSEGTGCISSSSSAFSVFINVSRLLTFLHFVLSTLKYFYCLTILL